VQYLRKVLCQKGQAPGSRVGRALKGGGRSQALSLSYCGRGFGRQEHVYRHQKICGQRQKERQELLEEGYNPDKEMRRVGLELGVHNFERDSSTGMYHCKECNHAFKNKRYIAEHYARNHRVENLKLPYRCDECGRGYKIMRDLIRHKKKPHVHKGTYMQKAFVCEIDGCGRRFGREFELKRHEKIHQGIKEHKCDQCDAEFHLRNCLKTHMKTVHDMELPKAPRRRKTQSDDENDPDKPKKKRKRRTKKELEEARLTGGVGHSPGPQQIPKPERTASGNGALNLSSTNPAANASPADQWIPQGLNQNYFGQNPLQSGIANWMSVGGLEQAPTMVPSASHYYHGTGGSVTPTESFHKETEDSNHSFQNRNSPNPIGQLQLQQQQQQQQHQRNLAAAAAASSADNFDPTKAAMTLMGITQPPRDPPAPVVGGVASNSVAEQATAAQLEEEKREKKKRKNQGAPMTEEERMQYEETISDKKLGAICSVCGKVFRNRDALDFHVMTTKMPGHGVLQIQRMKSNYAFGLDAG
jgi:hypothetical protein